MLTTTLNAILEHAPCVDGWQKLLAYLGKTGPDDELVTFATILDSNGLDDALWALRCVTGHDRALQHYAVWCARQVQHLMTDPRSVEALNVAERYADGLATDADLAAARAAVWGAAGAAAVTWELTAAHAASWAAEACAAWAAVWGAAGAAARSVARAAEQAAAGTAAWPAAGAAARAAARDAQAAEFRRRFCTENA